MEVMRYIRTARRADIRVIMKVMDAAKGIMRSSGNKLQWNDSYPSRKTIRNDIRNGAAFVVEDDGAIVAYFAYVQSPEPTYSYIEGGEWQSDARPYHVIHRIGSLPDSHGIFKAIMDWCFEHDQNIRIDTHRDNHIMQHCILKYGFTYCGIIYLESGDQRLAYQKIV